MSVAHETLVLALRDLLKLEEFAVDNLADISRYDFSCIPENDQKTVFYLLKRLKEDTGEHKKMIFKIIQRLRV